jgi:hypothetical protein
MNINHNRKTYLFLAFFFILIQKINVIIIILDEGKKAKKRLFKGIFILYIYKIIILIILS